MAVPKSSEAQIRYTIRLNGRDQVWPDLTPQEAHDMLVLGFRFSIFDHAKGEYRLSIPYAIMRMIDRDELVLIQDL